MSNETMTDPGYPEDATGRLELIWGDGFLSPGGPAEVSRVLGGNDITGCDVLDIGSGIGGVDVVLVHNHGAGTIVGIDVEQQLVDRAASRAREYQLDGQITYRVVDPGPLPFADGSFDVVFSKDALIHVRDKRQIYSEAFRVLRSGGRILVSDWLRGEGDALTPLVQEFIEASGHDFALTSLRETGQIVEQQGFIEVDLEDRHAWYLAQATEELAKLRGSLNPRFLELWGKEATQDEIAFWEVLVAALEEGAVRPGHIRAIKPSS